MDLPGVPGWVIFGVQHAFVWFKLNPTGYPWEVYLLCRFQIFGDQTEACWTPNFAQPTPPSGPFTMQISDVWRSNTLLSGFPQLAKRDLTPVNGT